MSSSPPTPGPFAIALYINETRASSWTVFDPDVDKPRWRLFRNAPRHSVRFMVWDVTAGVMYKIDVTQPHDARAGDLLLLSDISWNWEPSLLDPLDQYAHRTDKSDIDE